MNGYSDRLLDHYRNPRHVGSLSRHDPRVGSAFVRSPACGDLLKLQLQIDPATGTIERACFKAYGCGPTIACGSFVVERVEARSVDEALEMTEDDLVRGLDLPDPKRHCAELAVEGIRAAVEDFRRKQASLAGASPSEDL